MSISLSGSLLLTGSIVASGNLTTTGTITAQTLVVQTITSSIVNITGSNIFGSRLSDTQTFTGSLYITGSVYVTGSIGTTSNIIGDQILSTNNGNGTNFKIGDDIWLGDINLANTMQIKGLQNEKIANLKIGSCGGTISGYSGSIGIGTAVPLTHAGENASGLVIQGVNGCRGIIEVWDGSCGKAVFQQVAGTTYIGNLYKGVSGGSLIFLVNGSGTSATEAMLITCAGRVGIGNSSPSYGLDVCGTVRLTNGSTAQTVIISSTNTASNATTLQISNSSNSAFNDGIKIVQGGGVLRFHDLNDTALLGFDLSNTRVGVLTTSPGRALDVNGDSTLRGNNYINSSKMIQWEGGAYWSTRTTSSANQFEIYRGDTGVSPLLITSDNKIRLNGGSLQNFATVGIDTFTIDTMNGYQSIANGGYVDFGGMSGILFVNNWSNGGVTIWLLGGGNTVALGSVIATVGTAHHNPGIGGYRWCNNYGSTANFGFQVFRTRNTA